ncbi:MAG: bifunctional folylpolyglutamate synthase/dihydrofolate synthase [Bacteroidetes bacterium]|nr:bifunctional folylpolyglutamate synthase/dihydrofolate synthase [Bacteroidota bacterium]
MTYAQTVEWLYTLLPTYQLHGGKIKFGLEKTLALCAYLGNPQEQFKSIHIAGTNGKGSTSSMLAAILSTAGYRTGLYTSPHLLSFTERIRLNGVNVPEDAVVHWVAAHKTWIEANKPSFFELTVGMAFDMFAQQQVDIAIIEVGMGGRLDSTNVIQPLLSLITNIGWDHMQYLGDSLPAIAAEKAGIMKPNVPCILGQYQEEIFEVFLEAAEQVGTQVFPSWYVYSAQPGEWLPNGHRQFLLTHEQLLDVTALELDLGGDYQAYNLPGVFVAVDMLGERGFDISEAHIREALSQVRKHSGLRGRFEQSTSDPRVILDVAHNESGLRLLLAQVQAMQTAQLHIVLGVVRDKDLSHLLPLFPPDAQYYFCAPQLPRALPAEELRAAVPGLKGQAYPSVAQALAAARAIAAEADGILVAGSTFVVAEAMEIL